MTHVCVMCNALKNSRKEHMKGNLLCQNVKAKLKKELDIITTNKIINIIVVPDTDKGCSLWGQKGTSLV